MAQVEVSRLVSALGFKFDESGLDKFEQKLRGFKTYTDEFVKSLQAVNKDLSSLEKRISSFNKKLNLDAKVTKQGVSQKGVTDGYSKLSNYADKVAKAQEGITKNAPQLNKSLDDIRGKVWKGANAWGEYAKNITKAKEEMRTFKHSISDLRRGTGSVTVKNNYYGGRAGVASHAAQPRDSVGTTNAMLLGGLGGGVRGFLSSMTPSHLMAGGAVAAGYVTKEIVAVARKQQQMQQSLLFSAKQNDEGADYRDSLKFIQDESIRLGLDSSVVGKTFATIVGASQEKLSKDQTKDMFSGMSEYFTAVKASQVDQDLMWLAIQQMFSIGKLEGQELGQLTGRGLITRKQVYDAIQVAYNQEDTSKIASMQKAGKLNPHVYMPVLADMLSKQAQDSGALAKAEQSSLFQENVLKERFRRFSNDIYEAGLDKALAQSMKALVKLMEILQPVIIGFMSFIGIVRDVVVWLYKFIEGNLALVASIGGVVGIMSVFSVQGATLAGVILSMVIGTGNFAVALSVLARRFVPVIAAGWALYEVFTALDRHSKGELNFMSRTINAFRILGLEIEIAALKLEQFFLQRTMNKKAFDMKVIAGEESEIPFTDRIKANLGIYGTPTWNKTGEVPKNITPSLPDFTSSSRQAPQDTNLNILFKNTDTGFEQMLTMSLGDTQYYELHG